MSHHLSLLLSLHRLLDPNSNTEIANYPIYKILFCVRGHDGTPESDCFAFTESHYNTEIFRIHVFRCQIREAVRIYGSSHQCGWCLLSSLLRPSCSAALVSALIHSVCPGG